MGAKANASLRKQFLIAGCLYIGQLSVGFTLGWTAPVLAKLQNEEETPLDHVISDAQASWILSFIFLGTIIGPYLSAYLYNVIGRKPCLYIGGGIVMSGNDKRDEAMENLTSLGRQDDIDEVVAKANEKPKSNIDQLTEMYTIRSNRRATFIIIVLNILQQSSGVVAVGAFVTIIFDMTGSDLESHISTIIIGVTQVVSATIAPVLIDRTGRKSLLLISTAACSISLTALGTFFFLHVNDYPIAEDLQWLSLVSLMIFFIAYFAGFGIIPNTYIGEMFTDTCRGFGGTFTSTIAWVWGFGVSTAFGYMLPAWGPAAVFWIFSGACAFAFFFSALFVPETKGKSLLEIREILGKSWI
ncbi:hypothetical protein PYW07_010179 [Mythimna separata]|uniref:Major facilitator superfamily (MFS) profile domain-containing protein n=1 Tax=Mythimna separata TaxID=271217 RepID=A0AAD8DQB8_MYTSE|nr:hypothetical protein PYW07_010179 [Mythimna separata]